MTESLGAPTTTVSARAPAPRRPAPAPVWNRLVGWATEIPDRFVILALCAAVGTAVAGQLEIFHPYTVFPLFAVLAAASWKLAPGRVPVNRWQLIGVSAAIVVMVGWIAAQWPYFSEQVVLSRDPGIYTVRAFWLMDHPSPDVTLSQQLLDIHRAMPQAGIDFGAETNRLVRYLQSTTVVPGMLAAAGWIGGPSLLLKGDILIGGVGLMGMYAVGRRVAGPLLGLVPMVALAASMPMAAFSRTAYTEPLSMIAVTACLLGLWQGYREGRAAVWLLAGLGAGGVALTRIDGWLVIIGGAVGFGIWGAFSVSRATRRRVLRGLGWYSVGALATGGLGLTDLIFHSPDYLAVLGPSARPLIGVTPVLLVVAAAVTVVPGLSGARVWVARHSRAMAIAVVGVVGLAMVVMLLRPVLLASHKILDVATQANISGRQTAEGLPVDPSRSYDEQSLNWMSWYLGWPAVILACVAGLYAIWQAVRLRRGELVLLVAVPAVNAMLYLNTVSITPDQIWAMRRFLPVIMPGGLLLVGWLLAEIYGHRRQLGDRFLPTLRSSPGRSAAVSVSVAALAASVAFFPVTTWRTGIFTVREWAGYYDFAEQICTKVANQPVLLIGPNPSTGFYQPTLRNLCQSEVITLSMPNASGPISVAKLLKLWKTDTPVKVVTFFITGVSWTANPGPATFHNVSNQWEQSLIHRPANPAPLNTDVWIGTAQPDGTVVPG